ncbi:MAG: hypothetical protein H3C63_18140 [Candidatus Omnitrophica bacterium]|nr:hypothetical protein [Candidatus Omnitrophota bacterium]
MDPIFLIFIGVFLVVIVLSILQAQRRKQEMRAYAQSKGLQYHEGNHRDFDRRYKTGSGKNETTHNFSAVMLDTGMPLQPLLIRQESFFDKVGEFLGFDDIDFESQEFSSKFFVKSPNKKWAYDILHQKAMEYLLLAPAFTIEFQGSTIMAYRDKRFSIADFDAALTVIQDLVQLFPDYLLREWKGK